MIVPRDAISESDSFQPSGGAAVRLAVGRVPDERGVSSNAGHAPATIATLLELWNKKLPPA
jgi:hypothetical protein